MWGATLYAQNHNMKTTVSKVNVEVGERFKLEFKFDGKVDQFYPPDLSQFIRVSGPNQSSMSQYVNGKYSQSMTYSYILAGKKKGRIKISGARIDAHGKIHSYDDIVMNVSTGTAKKTAANQSATGKTKASNSDMFMKVNVSKRNVYVGEGISVTYTIYFKVDIVGNEVSQLPAFKGFWTQDVEMPKQVKVYVANVNGIRYQAADLKKTIVFPQRTGNLELDPMHFKAVVRTRSSRQSRSIFDNFFGGYKDVERIVKSKPIRIVVKPLPEKGKPRNFKGDVGKYKLVTSVDKTELTANDAASLVIKISGRGNIKLIDPLKLNLPPDVETYDPKITDRISVKISGVSGSRTYEHLLVPRHAGTYVIEPVQFSYFDPSKKKYITLTGDEVVLTVAKGEEGAMTTISGIAKEDLKFIGSDIMFIKNQAFVLKKKSDPFFLSGLFYGYVSSPFLCLFIFLAIRRRNLEQRRDVAFMRRKGATRLAKKHLSKAKKFMNDGDRNAFYVEVLKSLWGYVGDKLNVPVAELNKENIRESLIQKEVSDESIKSLEELVSRCEFAQYAPAKDEGELEVIYQDALQILGVLEHEIT